MSADFNLRALVRECVRSSITADPGLIATIVFSQIADEDHAEALDQALREIVREVIREERMRTQITSPQVGASAKVQGIRDHWQRALRDQIYVAEGEWKFLGDCTQDDLMFAAEQRREQASRLRAKAAQYDVLRGLLDEHGVKQVRDLPADVLVTSLGRAA